MDHSVYLAGPITGLDWEGATSWRDDAIKKLAHHNIRGLSPLRAKHYLNTELSLADTYDQHPMSTQSAITARDRFDCQRADLVLVNLLDTSRVSIGTCIEFGWADAARVPLVVAMDKGSIHDHAMVREMAGWIVSDIDLAVDIVVAVLGESIT